jgi:tetratricopeptide (TPR) repeat protein
MKTAYSPFLLILIIVFYSCSSQKRSSSLSKIDSLTEVNPTKALLLLNKMSNNISKMEVADVMYYKLLVIKASDKAYVVHKSDKDILDVVHYFEKSRDWKSLAEAYYYAGRVYEDLSDSPQAIEFYQKSADIVDSKNMFKLKSLVHCHIGYLFQMQHLYAHALPEFRISYRCDRLNKDTVGMIFNLRDIANTYKCIHKFRHALNYYQTAKYMAIKINDKTMYKDVIIQEASLYNNMGNYGEAKKLLPICMKNIADPDKSGVYSIAAETYYELGIIDTALICFNHLMECGSVYSKKYAYWGLADLSNRKQNAAATLKYLRKYNQYADSVEKITNTETVARMHSLYNYEIRKKQVDDLEKKEQQKINAIVFLSSFILLTIFGVLFLIMYHKQRKKTLLLKLERLEDLLENKKLEDQNYIGLKKNRDIAEIEIMNSDIFIRAKYIANDHKEMNLTSPEWVELEQLINKSYPNFTSRLSSFCHLSTQNFRICLLLKAGFNPTEISVLTNHAIQSVSSSRSRMYKKAFGKSGVSKDWDDFICSL